VAWPLPPWCRACHSTEHPLAPATPGWHTGWVSYRDEAIWSKVRHRKIEHWARQHRRQGPEEALRAAEALRAYVITLRPTWPDAQTRRLDWENHARMRTLFEKIANGLDQQSRRKAAR